MKNKQKIKEKKKMTEKIKNFQSELKIPLEVE